MKVSPDTVVRLAYRLYDSSGDLVDEVRAESPIEFVHGYAQVLPGLDGAIDGVAEREGCVAQLLPELAFGERSEEAMLEIDRHDFPGGADVQVGDEVLVSGPGGIEVPMPIVALTEALMLVDLNHPLAGQSVRFEIDVLTVRAATDEQIDAVQAETLTVYVGAAGGGVWKSVNGGLSFEPVFDDHVQSIGAVRIDPSDPETVKILSRTTWPCV